ncbi:hypothetical protein F3Y22_tig00110338pilonHSYRG00209 [Hibiscus syriacus]|uniref:Glabrous enhancer-binding protein-like DBD domain-containing protein n=1 Tax=Hibiscus syriacus TaxID=106335 RepID=A0A6A3AZS7_HIBSY|nr:STOREKEEPER protein-like [Hibiscus syriacus]KAE8708595.1 hypothetical protein F3Y22_tig00110338pilonHSYRG00209 [Hibiscus syriacus]
MVRKLPDEYTPPASSNDEESSDGSSNATNEEEEEKTSLKKQKADSGEVGFGYEYDSDKSFPSPNVSDFTIKPIVPKPNKSAPKPKQSANESSSKRKRALSSASDGGSGAVKSPVIVRRWSEAEEIAILKGLIEYKSKEGADSFKDSSSGFLDFIKKKFEADVSKTQLYEKIRRLKNKYKVNAEKGQNGNEPGLPIYHVRKCFQLSKKIWGNETNEKNNKTRKKTKSLSSADDDKPQTQTKAPCSEDGSKTEVNGGENSGLPVSIKDNEQASKSSTQISSGNKEDNVDFWKDFPFLKESLETDFTERWGVAGYSMLEEMGRKTDAAGREKLKQMEKAEKQLRIDRLELFLKKVKFAQEIAESVLNSIKGTGV